MTNLADLTSLRVGGPAPVVATDSESPLIEAIDLAGPGLLMLGGGSNVVCADQLDGITVVRDLRQSVTVDQTTDQVTINATAGANWDQLVAQAVAEGWSGFEALSGIPGGVGAAPVQNIGAYGAEVAQLITQVRAYDRQLSQVVALAAGQLGFGYRDSTLKRSLTGHSPTPRWVVLDVTFTAPRSPLSAPIGYGELANLLGIALGQRAPLAQVRQAVLSLRRSKGMVLDPTDHDTWSAGSFFTNPVIDAARVAWWPPGAPVFDVGPGPDGQSQVKASAAWLISQAGVAKGWGLNARATTSHKHVLALTNRGGADAQDIIDLAQAIQAKVSGAFGVTLTLEPVLVGFP